jgi:DNA replication licensing factor MCM4
MEDSRKTQSQSSAGNASGNNATRESSEPAFPSSDHLEGPETPRAPQTPAELQESLKDQVDKMYFYVRPYGMEKSTNLRDLNPSGE